ncbi:MAG: hypothetical protein JWL74_279 [Alphaproteobacteria bacterium]|jgi:hypothetical protein|nr:hypothetical protein [Alphaproteobacteria bacterium]
MGEKQERFPSKAPQEELIPGKTQNLSSALHHADKDRGVDDRLGKDMDVQRGQRAGFDHETGSVFGSGSNAGAGGTPGEDYDSDTAGGGTKPPVSAPHR